MIEAAPSRSQGGHIGRGQATAELAQPLAAAPERAARKLRRDIGLLGLLFVSLGSIIGAGWLFGALYASSLAGPGRRHLLGARRRRGDAPRIDSRGARRDVPGGGRQRAVPAIRLRELDRLHEWLDRVSRRRDRGADHGRGHAPVHVELHLLAHDRLGRPAGADRPGLLRRGSAAPALLHDQRHGRALARRHQHARGLLEAPGSGRDGCRADRDLRAHRELQRARWLHALRLEGSVSRVVVGRGHLRRPRLRTGGPARWRDSQPEAEHPLRDHRRDDRGDRPLHRPTGGVHLGTRPFELSKGWGAVSFSGRVRALRRTGDGTRPGLARCPALHGRNRLARRHRSALHGRERAPHLRTRSQRLHPVGLRPPLATRNPVLRDRVLVPLRPGDPPSVSRLAAARRLHLGGGRGRVRNGAARARSPQAPRS